MRAAPVLPLVLFDGTCGLCDWSVRAILRRDRDARFHFAPLQSPLGQRLLNEAGLPADRFDTLVLIDPQGIPRLRSDAALGILAELPHWRWTAIGRAVPRVLRDAVYAWIARRRRRLFPAGPTCGRVPLPWRQRFLA